METFSPENWNKLTMARKREHSLVNCKACYHYFPAVSSFYPVNSTEAKIDSEENPFN